MSNIKYLKHRTCDRIRTVDHCMRFFGDNAVRVVDIKRDCSDTEMKQPFMIVAELEFDIPNEVRLEFPDRPTFWPIVKTVVLRPGFYIRDGYAWVIPGPLYTGNLWKAFVLSDVEPMKKYFSKRFDIAEYDGSIGKDLCSAAEKCVNLGLKFDEVSAKRLEQYVHWSHARWDAKFNYKLNRLGRITYD